MRHSQTLMMMIYFLVGLSLLLLFGCSDSTTAPVVPTPIPTSIPIFVSPDPTVRLIGIVEAEECDRKQNCEQTGDWKIWSQPEFSNGELLTNEIEGQHGIATDVQFSISFQGSSVSLVYRQDTWYGSLRVEVDNGLIGELKQWGSVNLTCTISI